MKFGDLLLLAALVFVLYLAVAAIIRGYAGIKKSKTFDNSNKKAKIGYLAVSILHMLAGILIVLVFIIAGVLILINI